MIRDMSVLFLAAQEKSNYFSCYLLRTTLMLESCDMRHIQQDLARLSISNESVAQCSLLTYVDDVCPYQIYHHPDGLFYHEDDSFAGINPLSEKCSPCAQIPN